MLDGLKSTEAERAERGHSPRSGADRRSQARGTILYDAVYLAADEETEDRSGPQGHRADHRRRRHGQQISRDKAMEAAQKADAIIYSIFYQDVAAYGPFGGGGGGESRIAAHVRRNWRAVFNIDRRTTLDDAFKDIQDEMRSQYSLGYSSTNPKKDGSYRKLDIHMANKDQRSRRGRATTR